MTTYRMARDACSTNQMDNKNNKDLYMRTTLLGVQGAVQPKTKRTKTDKTKSVLENL